MDRDKFSNYDKFHSLMEDCSTSLNIDMETIYDMFNEMYDLSFETVSFSDIQEIINELILKSEIKSKNMFKKYISQFKLKEDTHKLNSSSEYEQVKKIIEEYNNTRILKSKCVCFAPYTTLKFQRMGSIKTCCYLKGQYGAASEVGMYPKNTIREAWDGVQLKKLRYNVNSDVMYKTKTCSSCIRHLMQGQFSDCGMNLYDRIFDKNTLSSIIENPPLYPMRFEFDTSNKCNSECITCGGDWSSSIRMNREKLPEQYNPYDQNFRKQLIEFYPHLKSCTFLGGEPFLNSLYYDIWDDILKINPNIEIGITTNGSILTDRIKDVLKSNSNIKLMISFDGFTKETYEFIRRPIKYETFMNNLQYFIENKYVTSFAINLQIKNWNEIPFILHFANMYNVQCYFNDVHDVFGGRIIGIHENGKEKNVTEARCSELLPEICLNTLPIDKLREIYNFYLNFKFHPSLKNHQIYLLKKINFYINSK